jgi:hypothetical protein
LVQEKVLPKGTEAITRLAEKLPNQMWDYFCIHEGTVNYLMVISSGWSLTHAGIVTG